MLTFSQLGRFTIISTLGAGSCATVKLAEDTVTHEYVAVKVMNGDVSSVGHTAAQRWLHEIEAVSKLEHANVVKVLETGERGEYQSKHGRTRTVCYIVMEYLPNKELLHVLMHTGKFEEPLARTYFQQLMSAVAACHAVGITHRDLKPDNILFDREFNLKICDFGFAAPIDGRDGQGFLNTYLGTVGYMAPEIVRREAYTGEAVDIYACGVILFIMVAGRPPFGSASIDDPHFNNFNCDKDRFWGAHAKNKRVGFFTPDFQDLINSMLSLTPETRPSARQALLHPWATSPATPADEAKSIIARRHALALFNQRQTEAAKRQTALHKQLNFQSTSPAGHYLGEMEESSDLPGYPLVRWDENRHKGVCVYTSIKPRKAFSVVNGYFTVKNAAVRLSDGKYKVKAQVETEEGGKVGLSVELLDAGDDRICIEVTKTVGDTWDLLTAVKELEKEFDRESDELSID